MLAYRARDNLVILTAPAWSLTLFTPRAPCSRLKMVPADGPDDLSKRDALLLQLEARRQAINRQEQADTVQRQRARTSWADSQRPGGANPTWDGLMAGCRAGSIYTLVGLAVVASATHMSPLFRSGSSPGGRAWLVCTAGMAGFFFNAEMAVVGSDARDKALQRSDVLRGTKNRPR